MAKNGGFPGGMPGNMSNLLKQAQKMQKQMEEQQKELEAKEFDAAAGGGAVKVTVSGKREVIKVVTPGTITNSLALIEDRNNYILCIGYISSVFGIGVSDISTGDFYLTTVSTIKQVYDEINKYNASELVYNPAFEVSGIDMVSLKEKYSLSLTVLDEAYFDEKRSSDLIKRHLGLGTLLGLGIDEYPEGMISAGALLQYLYDTQKSGLNQITDIKAYSNMDYMLIDANSRRNLELLETMREKKKQGSLLGVLDKTKTAMGARLLRTYIEQPLISREEILNRMLSNLYLIDI